MNIIDDNMLRDQVLACDCLCCRIGRAVEARKLDDISTIVAFLIGVANVHDVATFETIQSSADIHPITCSCALLQLIAEGHVRLDGDVYRLTFPPSLPMSPAMH